MSVTAVSLRADGMRRGEIPQRLSEKSPWQSAEEVCSRFTLFSPFCQRGGCPSYVRRTDSYSVARLAERLPGDGKTYAGKRGKAVQSGMETSGRTSYGTARTSESLG